MTGVASGSVIATENPKVFQGHLIPVLGHVTLEDLDAAATHSKAVAVSATEEFGPLVIDAVYQFTFFAGTGAGAIDSGVAPPDVRYGVFPATGGTVNTTSFPWPSSSERVLEIHMLAIGNGATQQRYVKFLNASAAKEAIIGCRRLR